MSKTKANGFAFAGISSAKGAIMQLGKLITYSFDKNVGTFDRAFRILSGIGLVAVGVLGSFSAPWHIILMIAGAAWAFTGLVSRCRIYYAFGLSSRRRT
jgi:hypothetical protein